MKTKYLIQKTSNNITEVHEYLDDDLIIEYNLYTPLMVLIFNKLLLKSMQEL